MMGAVVEAGTLITDNDAGNQVYSETGTWSTSSLTGFEGLTYRTAHPGTGLSTATWTPDVPIAQRYDVRVHYRDGGNRTTLAKYTVHHAEGESVLVVDQSGSGELVADDIGRFSFGVGEGHHIVLSSEGSNGYVIADAIELIPVDFPFIFPEIGNVTHSPLHPRPGDSVTIQAEVGYSGESSPDVFLEWRSGFSGETETVPMIAVTRGEDNITYFATLPSFQALEFVEYGVRAEAAGFDSSVKHRAFQVTQAGTAGPHVFIVAGQSNACGPGELTETNEQSHPAVLMFGSDYQWKTAYEPITDATNRIDVIANCPWTPETVRGHGFALRACKDLVAADPATCRLIPAAGGGTSLAEWQRHADPFDRSTLFGSMNYRRLVCSPEGITALWWYQGESDSSSPTFILDHRQFIASAREEISTDLPVIYAQLGSSPDSSYNSRLFDTGEKQRRMESGSGTPEEIEHHHMVVTFDLPQLDQVHLDQGATKELGRRFALATRQHIFGEDIDGTGPRLRTKGPAFFDPADPARVVVVFDREVSEPAPGAETLFRVDGEIPVSIARDPGAHNVLLLEMTGPVESDAVLTYGSPPASGLHIRRINVLKGGNDLPVPRFGPVEIQTFQGTLWQLR